MNDDIMTKGIGIGGRSYKYSFQANLSILNLIPINWKIQVKRTLPGTRHTLCCCEKTVPYTSSKEERERGGFKHHNEGFIFEEHLHSKKQYNKLQYLYSKNRSF